MDSGLEPLLFQVDLFLDMTPSKPTISKDKYSTVPRLFQVQQLYS